MKMKTCTRVVKLEEALEKSIAGLELAGNAALNVVIRPNGGTDEIYDAFCGYDQRENAGERRGSLRTSARPKRSCFRSVHNEIVVGPSACNRRKSRDDCRCRADEGAVVGILAIKSQAAVVGELAKERVDSEGKEEHASGITLLRALTAVKKWGRRCRNE